MYLIFFKINLGLKMKIYKFTLNRNGKLQHIIVIHYDLFKIVEIIINTYNITISDIVNISIKNLRTK